MDHDRFKQMLIRDKEWLEMLYSTSSLPARKRVLTTASDKKLDTLIRFFNLLSNGDIKMHKKNFEALETRYIRLLKKSFEKKSATRKLLNAERDKKLNVLQKLLKALPFLLYTLFNDEDN